MHTAILVAPMSRVASRAPPRGRAVAAVWPQCAASRQLLAEQPDRVVIEGRIVKRQTRELHDILGWPAAVAAIGTIDNRLQFGSEQLKIDHSAQSPHRVGGRRECRKPFDRIVETRLSRHHCLQRARHQPIESSGAPPEVFRGVQMPSGNQVRHFRAARHQSN